MTNKMQNNNSSSKWYRSLNFKLMLGIGILTGGLMAALILVANTFGKEMILEDSSRFIEQSGERAIAKLSYSSVEAATLTKTIAEVASSLPKNEATFKEVLPKIFDFHGDDRIAGGGVWPEPYRFSQNLERRSFFWGREPDGTLKYYNDYNEAPSGYHREEWYLVARYLQPGQCFWSRVYVDPYSKQPMVTCTVAIRENGEFWGAATVDLKLEGIQDLADSIAQKTGGYIFLTDRYNRLITLPSLVDVKGDRSGLFNVKDLA
ncbi:MAG: hypothetical protein F6K35_44650, partial [Okeania sp. SIO2H7]|nr:hypothetical protein [Okeania sp. SIO2H7]